MHFITNPEELDPVKWDTFIHSNPSGNPFNLKKYNTFFRSVPGYEPVFLAAVDESTLELLAVIQGVIQKEKGVVGRFSSRTIIFGGPVFSNRDGIEKILHEALSFFVSMVEKKSIYIETRNLFDYSNLQTAFEKNDFQFNPHLDYLVDCSDAEKLKKGISNSKLRQVKKSLKEGALVISDPKLKQVKDFYNLLHELYKTKVKKPLPDESFFLEFYRQKLGHFFLVEYKSSIIGGIMCPVLVGKTIYEWYIAGEDGKYSNIYPSVLATWAAIDYAANNRYNYFDFMGAGKPAEDYGVREFKSKFGGELKEYGRFIKINKPFLYQIGKIGLRILQFLR